MSRTLALLPLLSACCLCHVDDASPVDPAGGDFDVIVETEFVPCEVVVVTPCARPAQVESAHEATRAEAGPGRATARRSTSDRRPAEVVARPAESRRRPPGDAAAERRHVSEEPRRGRRAATPGATGEDGGPGTARSSASLGASAIIEVPWQERRTRALWPAATPAPR